MFPVLSVVYTSLACDLMNTTIKELQAHSARLRHVWLTWLLPLSCLEKMYSGKLQLDSSYVSLCVI